MNTVCSWSGGKDSCFALMQVIQQGYIPSVLLNMMNKNGKVSRSHGLPLEILLEQAEQMQLPLMAVPASWNDYENIFIDTLNKLKLEYKLDASVFGDIDLQAHRDWEEKVCYAASIKAILPLWKRNRKELVFEMLDDGIECMIVSCNVVMGEKYLGRMLTSELVDELESISIDPCGENGEFHTLVVNCPLFTNRISIPQYTVNTHKDYCFINWKNNT
ncbi:MAG: diphthine--ammonia ligase [Bacteroidetes bacterium]|nr:diphthine--ammonia ligase [Bacteroidota bacterium]